MQGGKILSDCYDDDESWIWNYQYDCDSEQDEKPSYEEWRQETGVDDTPENRGWYDVCDDPDEAARYWTEHPDWAKNF